MVSFHFFNHYGISLLFTKFALYGTIYHSFCSLWDYLSQFFISTVRASLRDTIRDIVVKNPGTVFYVIVDVRFFS